MASEIDAAEPIMILAGAAVILVGAAVILAGHCRGPLTGLGEKHQKTAGCKGG